MPQQVEGHTFPIHLEWLGGRNTFQQSNFSVRNAYICLEDMKDSDEIVPVVLEKRGNRVIFRTNNETMGKDFDLSSVLNVHVFPSDPAYAVFEISSKNGPSRFEVLHAPGNEPLKQVYDFIFACNFAQPSAPIQPREENFPSPSTSDTYETPESGQPVTNGVSTPEMQTEEGYEEVAVKLVDETINGHKNSLPSSEMEVPVQVKDDFDGEEVGKVRSSPSTTSVSSDTNLDKIQNEGALVEPVDDEFNTGPQEVHEVEAPRTIEVSRPRHFGKLRLLTNIIAEEGIDTKHCHDDGRLYVVSDKAFRSSKIRPFSTDNSVTEDGANEDGKAWPVIKVQPVNKSPTKHCETSKGKTITPERPVCAKCIGSEGRRKLRSTSPALRIRMQKHTSNVCECISFCNKHLTPCLFCYFRISHQPE